MLSELSTRDKKPALQSFEELCLSYPDRIAGGICQTHTKIVSLKIGDHYFNISGSANMTGNNARIEQYEISNNKEIYDFNEEWIVNPESLLNQNDALYFGKRELFL